MDFIQSGNKKKNTPNNNFKNGTFVCIFPGQEIKKKIRNSRGSLAPAQRDETLTELTEPFVINVHPASEGKCLHFLT